MIYSIYIVNKAGGLVFQKNYGDGLTQLTSNDYLILAVYGSTGIEVLETAEFTLRCFQTLTGTKILLFTDPRQRDSDAVLKRIYELYADYVMKNPFYQTEMPIRCNLFDRYLNLYCSTVI